MFLSTIHTFLLTVSTAVLLSASDPTVSPSSTNDDVSSTSDVDQGLPTSFPREPPPELRNIVPASVFEELTKIHQDDSLTIPEKIERIEAILRSLPADTLEQFPLPPVFRLLPYDTQKMLKAVRASKSLTMEEKWLHITTIIETLPEDQKRIFQQTIPDLPPILASEFKKIIPKEAWEAIALIQENINLDKFEKMKRIEQIIGSLSATIRQKLPFLSPYQRLPKDIQEQLKSIHMQQELSVKERIEEVKSVIESLPMDVKKTVFPHHYATLPSSTPSPSTTKPPIPLSSSSLPSVTKSLMQKLKSKVLN